MGTSRVLAFDLGAPTSSRSLDSWTRPRVMCTQPPSRSRSDQRSAISSLRRSPARMVNSQQPSQPVASEATQPVDEQVARVLHVDPDDPLALPHSVHRREERHPRLPGAGLPEHDVMSPRVDQRRVAVEQPAQGGPLRGVPATDDSPKVDGLPGAARDGGGHAGGRLSLLDHGGLDPGLSGPVQRLGAGRWLHATTSGRREHAAASRHRRSGPGRRSRRCPATRSAVSLRAGRRTRSSWRHVDQQLGSHPRGGDVHLAPRAGRPATRRRRFGRRRSSGNNPGRPQSRRRSRCGWWDRAGGR